ncbi:MAG: carboxymuconolactone decarboxylase family protein [Candidatus Sedimenticola sp. (ex Thyasira tokunagai)]
MNISEFMRKRNQAHANFKCLMPEVADNFDQLMNIIFEDGALSQQTKELIALGVSVTIRCEPCMHYHSEKAIKKGATKEQVLEAMAVGYEMGVGQLVPPIRNVLADIFKDSDGGFNS